jgi:hypothetical protein
MIITMIANIIIRTAFMLCITILSLKFKNTGILWWFLLTPLLGYEYKRKVDDDSAEKGGGSDA